MSRAKPGTRVEALFDFAGASEEDLPFRKGDQLVINSASEDPNWWHATDKNGKKGMIPANYVEILEAKEASLPRDASGKLMPMPWFHGKITRETAEELLKTKNVSGLYLIRESTNFPGDYTLCVSSGGGVIDHYRIQGRDGKITIDDESFFNSLEDLISHYEKDADGLACKLTKPLIKQGGMEFKVDKDAFKKGGWEISRKDLSRGDLLGSGEFGDVYVGTYKGEKVAIKTLKDVAQEAVAAFLSEADVMTKLRHPNLVQLIGVCTSGNPIMIVSEFMAKGCLLDYLRSRGRSVVTPGVQLKFCKDICSAMAYLESKNVVHRDLAVRNILLNENDVAKVADFGLAKDSGSGQLNLDRLPIKWTAPEAIKQKVSTSKSDVWSFGVVMWEIYSFGRVPYPKMSQKEVVESVLKGYRMEKPDACPQEVYDKIIRACWEIDAVKRPTFKAVLKTLDHVKE